MRDQISVVDGKILKSPDGFPKIDIYVQPDETECRHLIEDCKINEHTLHSAMDPDEQPRIEFDNNYTAVIVKFPKQITGENEFLFRVNTFGGFFFHSGHIIAVTEETPPDRRLPGSRDGIHSEKLVTTQDVMLRWLSQTIRAFEIQLRLISTRRDQLKETISRSSDNRSLMNMFTLREGLVYYIDALRGNGHLIKRLRAAAGRIGFSQENVEFLDDLAIENQQFLEQAQINSQVLTELMDARASIINNNLSVIMKNMNSLMIAIAIPSFFTGLGGMSEFTSFVSPYLGWYVAYPLFLGIMAIVSMLVYNLVQHFYKT